MLFQIIGWDVSRAGNVTGAEFVLTSDVYDGRRGLSQQFLG